MTTDMLYLRREQAGLPASRYVLLADQVKGLTADFHTIVIGTEFLVTVDRTEPKVILEATLRQVPDGADRVPAERSGSDFRAAASGGQRRPHH
ncbi:MAG: hypothetical protein H7099_15840 [Gemmatimonadaceae bacterium]|nr:hypothetical protein [Gemmatimonadaceae bacterium]